MKKMNANWIYLLFFSTKNKLTTMLPILIMEDIFMMLLCRKTDRKIRDAR